MDVSVTHLHIVYPFKVLTDFHFYSHFPSAVIFVIDIISEIHENVNSYY